MTATKKATTMATIEQSNDDRKRLGEILKSGHCLECGGNNLQQPTAFNETMLLTCLDCGSAFMVDLCREAWV